MAYRSVRTLAEAVAIAGRSGGGGVLVDALHVQRCGVPLAALRAVDPALISYVQLCDAPLAAPGAGPASADAVHEARAARLLPGEGQLPLRELLAALPDGIPVAVEAPRSGRGRATGAVGRSSRRGRGGRWIRCCASRRSRFSLRFSLRSVPGAVPVKGAALVSARLAVRDLSKHYGGVQALRGVTLHVDPGEVLGVVGDNGAGKSTMLKILSGAIFPSSGAVLLDGEPVRFANPAAAHDAGIATVYQDLSLAGQRDVVANFFLGRETLSRNWLARRIGWLDGKAMAAHTVSELARLRTSIPDVHLASRDLSGGQRQALAIARAAAWTGKVLLLDEPTSALGVEQQEQVLDLIRRVSAEGIAVILISHQMPDVLAVCDRAVVLRLGAVAATLSGASLTSENLVGYITGAMPGGEA